MNTTSEHAAQTNEVHTPGPWSKSEMSAKDRCFVVAMRDGRVVGDIAELHYQSSRPKSVQIANARLIAASPDLLEAASAVLSMLEREGRDTGIGGPLSDLRDAVAKAEGRSL